MKLNIRTKNMMAAETIPEMREALQPAFNEVLDKFTQVATGHRSWIDGEEEKAASRMITLFEKMLLKAPDSQRGREDITRENMFQAVLDGKLTVDQAKGLLDVLNMIDGNDSELDDDGKPKNLGFTIKMAAV